MVWLLRWFPWYLTAFPCCLPEQKVHAKCCCFLQERYQCHLCLLELVPVGGSGPGILCVAGWYGLAKAECCRPTQQCYKILNKHLAFFFATFMLCCISIFGKTPFSPISVTKGDKFGVKRQCRLCSQYLLYAVFVSNSAVLSEFCELGRWIVLDIIISTISAW